MVQTQIDQLTKVEKDLLVNAAREKQACEIRTRGGATTQDPLYPEGHPKRIEQDSQCTSRDDIPSKKKKKHKTVAKSFEAGKDPNSVSISDEPGDAFDKEEVEEEPEKIDKNAKYTKEDFITNKHGKGREPWVQKPMPFPGKKHKSKEEEHYNRFCEWMRPLFLQIPLTEAIKMPPYSKYMKDIVTNKRKIHNEEISTLLANYSFDGKVLEKLGDPGIPTIPCSIKNNYLEKLVSTDISLQMADKSSTIPIGICENVPVQVVNSCLILTDFVVLEMPEDDNMSIILGRTFLNTAGAIVNCNQGKVTFNVNDKEYTVYFPKKIDRKNALNSIKHVETIRVGQIICSE
jgi:hypothetical protein